jgi:aryl-alcohol dehydrogenase-like predicted oxidoreductase
MNKLTRREILKKSLLGFGAANVSGCWAGPFLKEAAAFLPSATDRIEIGKSGVRVSRIALGTGFHGWERASNQTRLGQKGFTDLMRRGFDAGLNFYDMADLYGSHPFMKNTLKELQRDKVVLLSKIWFSGGNVFRPTDRATPDVERFLGELGVDYLDVCLIHCVQDGDWPKHRRRMMDEMSFLKQKRVIRNVGVSCHDFAALRLAAEAPWVDVIFARINPEAKSMDVETPGRVKDVADTLKRARANGKFVVGMKIFGAGELVGQEQRDASLRYVWGNKLVDAMTIGFEKPAQVDDTVAHLTRVLQA